jgi:putative transcriptional regulator
VKNILPELRAKHGWTQADLAARLGISRQSIIAIETGRYDPSLPLAFEIAEVFKLPLESIFQHEKGKKK